MKLKVFNLSLLFWLLPVYVFSQEPKIEYKGLAFGVDISGIAAPLISPGWSNYEIAVIGGNYKNVLATFELGQMRFSNSKNEETKKYNYKVQGNYYKLGFDYNMYSKNKPGENNLVFVGMRYGFSNTMHSASNIMIMDSVWGAHYASLPEKNANSHWAEVLGGIRVQFFENFAVGWTVRYKIMLSAGFAEGYQPYYIAGFGKGANSNSFGFTYSLFYTIPLVKVGVLP